MTEYIIVRDAVATNVEDEVSKRLNDGWKCQGGATADEHYFMQAMVKDETPAGCVHEYERVGGVNDNLKLYFSGANTYHLCVKCGRRQQA